MVQEGQEEKSIKKMLKCKNCGIEFLSIRDWHVFCSKKCRVEYWKEIHTYPSIVKKLQSLEEEIEQLKRGK